MVNNKTGTKEEKALAPVFLSIGIQVVEHVDWTNTRVEDRKALQVMCLIAIGTLLKISVVKTDSAPMSSVWAKMNEIHICPSKSGSTYAHFLCASLIPCQPRDGDFFDYIP